MELSISNIPANGDDWESLCLECYRYKYQDLHFTEIPAVHKGDAGIEGFTASGVVCQCYCPEREYSSDELYNHLRDKMTTDLGKLISPDYAKRLVALGVPCIHEWHFMIPKYEDSRIIQHAQVKRKEITDLITNDPSQYGYIAPDFSIYIKTFKDLRIYIVQLLRADLLQSKLSIKSTDLPPVDWTECESVKVENIRRKIVAVRGHNAPEIIDRGVKQFSEAYLKGLGVIERLRVEYPPFYEELYELQQTYAAIVEKKSMMLSNSTMNSAHFTAILDDFGKKLTEQLPFLSPTFITELQQDLVSGWLADCSLEFV